MGQLLGGGWNKSNSGGLVDSSGNQIRVTPPHTSPSKKPIRLGIAAGITLPRPEEEEEDDQLQAAAPPSAPSVLPPPASPPQSAAAVLDTLKQVFQKSGLFANPPAPVAPVRLVGGWPPVAAQPEAARPVNATCVNCGGPHGATGLVCQKCDDALSHMPPEYADQMRALANDPAVGKMLKDTVAQMTPPAPQPAPVLAVKTKSSGKVKFYWQYDAPSSQGNPTPVFMITPKKYFDSNQCLDDSFDSDDKLPAGFGNLSESYFEFDGTRAAAESALRADPIFQENIMFPALAAPPLPAQAPTVAQMISATSGQNFKSQKEQLVKEFKKIDKGLAKALEDGGIVAEDDITRIMLDEDALREWIKPKKDEEDDDYYDEPEEKKPVNEVIAPKLDPVKWLVKSAIRRVFPKGDVEVMSGEVYLIHQV